MSLLAPLRLMRSRNCTSVIKENSHLARITSVFNIRCRAISSRNHLCLTKHTLKQSFILRGTQPTKLLFGIKSLSSEFHTSPSHHVFENREAKSLAVWTNLRELRASPLPALSLGFSGLIPFIGAPAYMVAVGCYMPDIAFAQLAYGASILSFLGGVRWGFVLPEESVVQPNWINLGYSVAPSLVAWVGLLAPQAVGIMTVIGGLGFSAYLDMAMYGYPPWFKGLRFLLSFFAILSLWSTFMFMFVLKEDTRSPQTENPDKVV